MISSQYSAFGTTQGETQKTLYTPAYNTTATLKHRRSVTATEVNWGWYIDAQTTYATAQYPNLTECYEPFTRIAKKRVLVISYPIINIPHMDVHYDELCTFYNIEYTSAWQGLVNHCWTR